MPTIEDKKYVILSDSEISHRTIDLLSLRGKRSDEAISREGEFPQRYILRLLGGILHFYYKAHNADAF